MSFNSSVSTPQKSFCRVTVIINDNNADFIQKISVKYTKKKEKQQTTPYKIIQPMLSL